MAVKYKFYATLLDAYQWYLTSDSEEAFQEFINKINRVPFTSEAAEAGTAFNQLVDLITSGELVPVDELGVALFKKGEFLNEYEVCDNVITFGKFTFKWPVVYEFAKKFERSISQIYTEAILTTAKGDVLLYGYIDEMIPGGVLSDIKTTSNYTFPKYLHNYQHLVYPYCMRENGVCVEEFSYDITDFKNIYKEDYIYQPERDIPKLTSVCLDLIDFIESHRELITDKKIFANEPVPVA